MPGALDVNGIWQYATDDSDVVGAGGGKFSGTLNKLAASVSTVIGGVLTRLTALEAKGILQRTTTQSIATATNAVVTYDATDLVNTLAGAFTITRSTGTMVCAAAGTYKFEATADFASSAAGLRQFWIQKAVALTPTVFVIQSYAQPVASANGSNNMTLRKFLTLAVGDVIQIGTAQTSGGALNIVAAQLEIKRIA
jgi:hypothetical protein